MSTELPALSLEAEAEIERSRALMFKTHASKAWPLLFPSESFQFVAASTEEPADEPQPANLKLQLKQFSAQLFDFEAVHYLKIAPDVSTLKAWLEIVADQIQSDAIERTKRRFVNIRCTIQERKDLVKEALASRIGHWCIQYLHLEAGPKVDHGAVLPDPIDPVGGKHIWNPAEQKSTAREERARPAQDISSAEQVESGIDEISHRAILLAEYKQATGNPSNKAIYTAKNSGIHKPEFFNWVNGKLHNASQTCINFERFLREKKQPVPRKPRP